MGVNFVFSVVDSMGNLFVREIYFFGFEYVFFFEVLEVVNLLEFFGVVNNVLEFV